MNPLWTQIVGSFVRFALAYIAGVLTSRGVWTSDQASLYVEALTVAAATAILSLGWSLWEKYRDRIKLTTALASPHTQSEASLERQIAAGSSAPASTPKDEVPTITPPPIAP